MRDRNAYASLREGLVGAWIPSISGSGLLLPDLSGQGNNGTLTNMDASDWVSSQYGRALDFDGSDDYCIISNWQQSTVGEGDFSISCWVKCDDLSTATRRICGSRSTSLAGYIFFQSASSYRFLTDSGGAAAKSIDTGVTVKNTFVNLIATRKSDEVTVFVDSLKSGLPYVENLSVASSQPFYIGTVDLNTYFDGQLDDIRIYNRALSESEIKLLASRPGIGLRPQRRSMYYAPPTGARRRRILTSMP